MEVEVVADAGEVADAEEEEVVDVEEVVVVDVEEVNLWREYIAYVPRI